MPAKFASDRLEAGLLIKPKVIVAFGTFAAQTGITVTQGQRRCEATDGGEWRVLLSGWSRGSQRLVTKKSEPYLSACASRTSFHTREARSTSGTTSNLGKRECGATRDRQRCALVRSISSKLSMRRVAR